MATVPGTPFDPDEFYGGIEKALRPTQADLLLAAGMLHQQGAFDQPGAPPPRQLAMDTSGLRTSTNIEDVRASGPFDPALRQQEMDRRLQEMDRRIGRRRPPSFGPSFDPGFEPIPKRPLLRDMSG